MNKKEKLLKDIEDARRKLDELEQEEKLDGKNAAIKKLSEYTVEEKVKFFDMLYDCAEEELKELETKGYSNEDNAHYAWETYIAIIAKEHDLFWEYWNSLSE